MEHARGSNIFFLNLKYTLQKFDQKPKNQAALTDDFTILPPMNPLQSHGLLTKFGLVVDPFSLVPLLGGDGILPEPRRSLVFKKMVWGLSAEG